MAIKKLPQAERLLSGTLSALLSDVATTMTVSNPPAAAKLPSYIEIDPDSTDDQETVRAVSVSGSVVTIERGVYSGGVGKQHTSGATYKEKITQEHWDAVVDAMEAGYLLEDASLTFTRNSTSIFRVNSTDHTSYYTAGRIVRLNGSVIVTVVSSAYSGGNTVVTCNETTVPTPITSVEVAIGPAGALDIYITPASTNTLTNKTLTSPKIGTAILDTNGNEIIKTPATASAVNEITATNAATGESPEISATGGDTDIGLKLTPKGAGKVEVTANDIKIPTAGNIQPNGSDPKRGFYIPAAALAPATTNGCAALTQYETTTNKVNYKSLDFDGAAEEYAWLLAFQVPDYWDLSTITIRFHWTAASGSGDVIWGAAAVALSNDDALDTALGSAQTVTDTLLAAGDVHVTADTSALTVGGTPAKGDLLFLRVYRDADAGGDTLNSVDARLIGITVKFGIAQYDDQ